MIHEILVGFGMFVGYYVVAASMLLIIRAFLKPPKELFRKLLHVACVMSVLVLLYAFDTWYLAALAAIGFALLLYPVISFIERFPGIMEILVQRKSAHRGSSQVF